MMQRYNAHRLLFLWLVLVLLSLSGLVWSQDQKKNAGDNPVLGRIQKKTYDFKEAGKEMEYALFVPTTYKKGKKTPLMVALHGLGSNPQQILRYPSFTGLAEKNGYILVAPMGYNSRGWYGVKGPRSPKTDPENLGELSEKDVMNVLALVREDFTIDEKRIYLMGHSMGGGGTWHLGLKYPELWAGLAPIAPAIFRKASSALAWALAQQKPSLPSINAFRLLRMRSSSSTTETRMRGVGFMFAAQSRGQSIGQKLPGSP